jgi:hypothetical protein
MKTVLCSALSLLLSLGGLAWAGEDDQSTARSRRRVFNEAFLKVVDSEGKLVGAVVDGINSEFNVQIISQTRDGRPFLIDIYPQGFNGPTIFYTGADCTGLAYSPVIYNPELTFLEVAGVGVHPVTGNVSAFLVDPDAPDYVSVDIQTMWYNGECMPQVRTMDARRVVSGMNLDAFTPPFAIKY